MGLGTGEIILILVVVMVIFGSTKLPQLGDGLGKAIKNFKRSVGGQNEIEVAPKDKSRELKGDPIADPRVGEPDAAKRNG